MFPKKTRVKLKMYSRSTPKGQKISLRNTLTHYKPNKRTFTSNLTKKTTIIPIRIMEKLLNLPQTQTKVAETKDTSFKIKTEEFKTKISWFKTNLRDLRTKA